MLIHDERFVNAEIAFAMIEAGHIIGDVSPLRLAWVGFKDAVYDFFIQLHITLTGGNR